MLADALFQVEETKEEDEKAGLEVVKAKGEVEKAIEKLEKAEHELQKVTDELKEVMIRATGSSPSHKVAEALCHSAIAKKDCAIVEKNSVIAETDCAIAEKSRAIAKKGRAEALVDDLLRRKAEQLPRLDLEKIVARSPSVRALENNVDCISPQIHNYWKTTGDKNAMIASESYPRIDKLREQVAKHYQCAKRKGKDDIGNTIYGATCCVTGVAGSNRQVVAAHLLLHSVPRMILEKFDMEGVDDIQNLVLLAKNLEDVFDMQRVCFVLGNEETGDVVLHLLDPTVESEPIFQGSEKILGILPAVPWRFVKASQRSLSHVSSPTTQ